MEHMFDDVYSETTVHLATHWSAGDDSYSSVHLNLYVPKDFLRRLTSEYWDRFAGSVQSCIALLRQPLFGRENGERLELSTHLGGVVPLRYYVIRENDMPPAEIIDGLGWTFEQFVVRFAGGSMRPTEERKEPYFSSSSIDYRRTSKSADAQMTLHLQVPATITRERFEAFRARTLTCITFRQEAGKSYIRSDEQSSALGYGLLALAGDVFGKVTVPMAIEEIRELFCAAAADLCLSD